jgi:hypothetical protein
VKTPTPRISQLHIRIETSELDRLRRLSKQRGVTMTEIIISRLRNLPIPDYAQQRELYEALRALTWEMNHIGNNINQVTVNLHIMRKNRQPPGTEQEAFNRLLSSYLVKLEEVRASIDKLTIR